MKVEWSELARDDLRALQAYIARDSPLVARQFIQRIIAAVDRLRDFPEIGRQVPEAKSPDVREVIFRDYRIIYELYRPDRVVIHSVIHGRRDLARISNRPWR